MTLRKLILASAAAALTLVAATGCDNDSEGDNAAAAGPLTLKQFAAADIASRTADDREPIELNDLAVDTSSENPADYDDLLPST